MHSNNQNKIKIFSNRKPIEIIFKELELTLKMPVDLDCYSMAIRGLWLLYDHYSDQGSSFLMPDIPAEYKINTGLILCTQLINYVKKKT